nr:glycosyltransferase family 4 protein [Glycomyces sp. YM15]
MSSFNRSLCRGLVEAGALVACLVPRCSAEERADAAAPGVALVESAPLPGGTDGQLQMRRPRLPWVPDIIVGHDRFTGPAALSLAEDHFPSAAFVPFLHIDPDELAPWRQGAEDDAAQVIEARVRIQFELSLRAHRVVAVGPRLHERMRRDLSVSPGAPAPIRFDPGFDHDMSPARPPTPGEPVQILVMGRVDDYKIKGLDLAAKALAHAVGLCARPDLEVELLVRGAPPRESARLDGMIRDWKGGADYRVTVRPFTTVHGTLRQDLHRASLVLKPSRADSWGLVGAEAITACTPILVSGRGGLGTMLNGLPQVEGARSLVVPVTFREREDVERWGHRIAAVLEERSAAFARVAQVKVALAAERTWADSARRLLDACGDRQ